MLQRIPQRKSFNHGMEKHNDVFASEHHFYTPTHGPGYSRSFKTMLQKYLMRHIIFEDRSSDLSIPEIAKRIMIKDAVYWSPQSWDEATPKSLAMVWNKLVLISDFPLDHIDTIPSC